MNSCPKLRWNNVPVSATMLIGGRLRRPTNGMIVKPAHHTAADSSEMRTAMPVLRPIASFPSTTTRLMTSRTPPPR